MTCSEYELLVSLLADGELDGAKKKETEAHIAACASCKKLYQQYLSLQQDVFLALEDCDDIEIQLPVLEKTKQKFSFRLIGAAAATLIAIALGTFALLPDKEPVQKNRPVVVKSKPSSAPNPPELQVENTPSDAPKVVIHQQKRRQTAAKLHVAKQPIKRIVHTEHKPEIREEAAEVTVEYVEGTPIDSSVRFGITDNIAQPPPTPNNNLHGLVAVRETISADGTRADRFYYIQHNSDNLGDPKDKEPQ
jgi:hypothetical protein